MQKGTTKLLYEIDHTLPTLTEELDPLGRPTYIY